MNIRLPHITGKTNEEKIGQVVSYLRELALILERELAKEIREPAVQENRRELMVTSTEIIGRGERNGWYWRKYSDGTAECWRRIEQTVDCTGSWGGLFYGSCQETAFPFTFAAPPVCTVTVSAQRYTSNSVWLASLSQTTQQKPGNVIAVSPDAHQAEICVAYYAIGRWRE